MRYLERRVQVLLVLNKAREEGRYVTVPEIVAAVNSNLKHTGRKTWLLRRTATISEGGVRSVLEELRRQILMIVRFRSDPNGNVTIQSGPKPGPAFMEWLLVTRP